MKKIGLSVVVVGIAMILSSTIAYADDNWFLDVRTNDPNYAYIADLYNLHKITGKQYRIFGPNDPLTRAQFVTMVTQAFNINSQPNAANPFQDVDTTDWYYQYVVDAYSNGIITGVSETKFSPDTYVTKEQAAQVIFSYLGNALPPNPNSGQMDVTNTDTWAKPAVANILAYGFRTEGVSNTPYFSKNIMTRGQAAALIDLSFHFANKTPAPKLTPISIPLPPISESNILTNSDGSKTFTNLSQSSHKITNQKVLTLFNQVKFSIDSDNNVTLSVPDGGSYSWNVQSYSGNNSWEGSSAKILTFTHPSDFEIILYDSSNKIHRLVSVYVQNRNSQWYARYY